MRGFVRLFVIVIAWSCRATEPANRPLDRCRASCEAKAKRQCTAAQCERGCEMILDRILEREGENVIRCVAKGPRICTDVVWADCATHIGVHADGGPPAPAPAPDDE
jgi:hypothetical protein